MIAKKTYNIDVVVVAYKEYSTIGPIIEKIEKQLKDLQERKVIKKARVIIIAPDKKTRDLGKKASKYSYTQTVEVPVGKPKALDYILKSNLLTGDIIVFTDGDLAWSDYVIEPLLKEFEKDKNIGAVAGHLVPTNSKNTMMGYWAYVTTQAGAHVERLKAKKQKRFLNIPGGIFAIKKHALPEYMPHDILGDDIFFTLQVHKKGYRVSYAPDAVVFVKYPVKLKDWIKQKKRTAGAEYQIRQMFKKDFKNIVPMRSFKKEVAYLPAVLRYASNFKEFIWSLALIQFRLYTWIMAFIEQKIFKRNPYKVWKRVESSKLKQKEVEKVNS